MKSKQKKIKISISIDRNILESIDDKTDNRSKYFEYVLEFYFNSLGIDISKIKL
jgi:hypothetical protein